MLLGRLIPAKVLLCTCFLFQLLLVCPAVYGQTEVSIAQGRVTQLAGSPLNRAKVIATSLANGTRYSALTDRTGHYVIDHLPAGNYKLRFEGAGFKPYSEDFVFTFGGLTTQIDVRLAGIDSDQVSGSAATEANILKIDRTDVSTTITPFEIQNLPVFKQNLSRLESLVPGALQSPSIFQEFQNPQQGASFNVNGQRFSGTGFSLDGVTNHDPLEGLVVIIPSLDAAAGMKVTTQNYSAEFGEATAGFVAVQTWSGTNNWHGTVYDYRQSGFGQASVPDFGLTSVLTSSTQKRSDFGGALGGPLKKDRLFVFGDYRGVRTAAEGTVLLTVPTKTVHDTCLGPDAPATMPNCDLSEYVPLLPFSSFPALLPNTNLSPQMLPFLKLIPLPNGPGLINNFTKSGADTSSTDNFDVRSDYVISGKVKVFGRYSFANFRENGEPAFGAAGGIGTNPSGFAGRAKDRNQGIMSGFSYNPNSSLLTDFRFGFLRYKLALDSLDEGTRPAMQAGIDGLNLPGDFYSSGMPDMALTNPGLRTAGNRSNFLRLGYSALNSCNCPLRELEQQFQWQTNWTKTSGSQLFKWGADIRYLQNFRLSSQPRRAGHLQFGDAPTSTGFSLDDFLLGDVSSFTRTYNPTTTNAGERQRRLFFYGEDTWRVTSQLTLNYGLRWEIYFPQSVTGTGEGGWLQLGSGAAPADDRFLVAGQAGTNLQGNVQTTLHNFGPRLGLAYLVNPDTVIRAGYGRAFDPGYGGSIFGIAVTQSPPVSLITTDTSGFTINSANPVAGNICVNGICKIPLVMIPKEVPFTIRDLSTQNPFQQANLYALPRRLRLPTVDAWNVALQHALDHYTYFEISYVGNKGTHVLTDSFGQFPFYDLNVPTLNGFIGVVRDDNCQKNSATNPKFYCKTSSSSRKSFQPWTSEVDYFGNAASSNYNSLQVKVRRQLSSRFSMLAAYTWAKVLDYDSIYYAIDPKVSHGVGNFDRTHSFVIANTWSLPVGRGRTLWGDAGPVLDRIVGGWSLAAVTLVSSGSPFTPTYSGCTDDIGTSNYLPCRPNLVGTVHITGNPSQYFTTTNGQTLLANCAPPASPMRELCLESTPTTQQGFDPMSGHSLPGETIGPWQRPGAGQIGDAGRNSLRGPGFFQADLTLAKEVAIKEGVSLRFRADAFNVFNNVNLGNPNSNVDGPSGGQITSLAIGAIQRQMQFSLRVEF